MPGSILGSQADDSLTGFGADQSIFGLDGNDTLVSGGTDPGDNLFGGAGNDLLLSLVYDDYDPDYPVPWFYGPLSDGGEGDDTIEGALMVGGLGNDSLTGLGDYALADYAEAAGAVMVDLEAGTVSGAAGNDTLSNVHYVEGSGYGDVLLAGRQYTAFYAGAGNDSLVGADSTQDDPDVWNHFEGGSGDDTLVAGRAELNQMLGDDGEDLLVLSGSFADYDFDLDYTGETLSLFDLRADGDGEVQATGIEYLQFADGTYAFSDFDPHEVVGTPGADLIEGIAWLNWLSGYSGNDTLIGGSMRDRMGGGNGNDLLAGGAGNDSMLGENGSDTLQGGDGDDTLEGTDGDDLLQGGNGDDWIYPGMDSDTVDGGEGFDVVTYGYLVFAPAGVFVDMEDGTVTGADIAGTLSNVERVMGSWQDDVMLAGSSGSDLNGDDGYDVLLGGQGNDTLDGGYEDDFVAGGPGDDLLDGGDFGDIWGRDHGDVVSYSDADGSVHVDLGAGTASGAAGNDLLAHFEYVVGSAFDDTITGAFESSSLSSVIEENHFYGGAGNDLLQGGAGDDTFTGGEGDDTLDGGEGIDTASYADASTGVVVLLGGASGSDTLINVEAVVGSEWDDVLGADDSGSALYGGEGNDTLIGGLGDDTLEGGLGTNWLTYAGVSGGVSVNLGAGTASGAAGDDSIGLYSFYGLVGTSFDDQLSGHSSNNVIEAGDGNDTLDGHWGNDLLVGGAGNDVFEGGEDNDTVQGGDGVDTLLLASALSQYTVAFDAATGVFTVGVPYWTYYSEGIDSISGIELFAFADGTRTAAQLGGAADGADSIIGSAGSDSRGGLGGNDTLSGGSGNDTLCGGGDGDLLDGGDGVDVAAYSGLRASYTVAGSVASLATIADLVAGRDGTDALSGVERLQFSDTWVALDLAGAAGVVAKTIGAVFGSQFVGNPGYVGIGLSFMDDGATPLELVQMAIDANPVLGRYGSNANFVSQVAINLLGSAPSAGELAAYVAMLDSQQLTQAQLAEWAMELALNAWNIGLAGLTIHGLDYIPS